MNSEPLNFTPVNFTPRLADLASPPGPRETDWSHPMSKTQEILDSLSLAQLRRLVTLMESQEKVEELLQTRDRHLEEARLIQRQIDDLLDVSQQPRRKREGPSVKSLCEEVLRGRKTGMTPAEVKDSILKRHPDRNNRTFYNQVFIALTRNKIFKKGADGTFILSPGSSTKRKKSRTTRRG